MNAEQHYHFCSYHSQMVDVGSDDDLCCENGAIAWINGLLLMIGESKLLLFDTLNKLTLGETLI